MKTCLDCIHFNVCCYVDQNLPICDSFIDEDYMVKLPCNIGDVVYQPSYKFTKCTACDYEPRYAHDSSCEGCEAECDSVANPYIYVGKVVEMNVLSNGTITVKVRFTEKWDNSSFIVGLSVFLSKEDAEKKLKEQYKINGG